MKLKKLVASTLVASMVVSGVATLSTQKEISATTAAPAPVANPDVGTVDAKGQAYPNSVLMANAKANSAHNQQHEGPASNAFDNNMNSMWHTAQNNSGNVTADSPKWIQTGFSNVEELTKLEYLGRNIAENAGKKNNKIKEYELWVSTSDTEPDVAVPVTQQPSVWTKVETNATSFDATSGKLETITLAQPVKAKWVRLVVKSVVSANGNNYAVASDIKLYTKNISYNLNSYAQNWEYQVASEKMATQDETDRWVFEVCDQNGVWNKMSYSNNYWRLSTGANIGKDGFRQDFSPNKAYSASWVAPRKGYFEFSQSKAPGGSLQITSNGKLELDVVDSSNQKVSTLHTIQPGSNQQHVFKKEFLMDKGSKFKFSALKTSTAAGVINYCDFNGGYAPWEVKDVTKEVANTTKSAADELLTATTADSKYKQALTTAKNELEGKLTATNDELVPAIEKVNTAMNQLKNIKLMNYIDTVSGYTWTDETAVKAALEVAKTAGDKALTEVELNDAIKALRSAVNASTRTYTIKLAKDGMVLDTISAANYNTVASKDCTISAPTAGTFNGWYRTAANGQKYLVSKENTFKVAALSDVTYDAVYDSQVAPQTDPIADIQNAFFTKVDTKFTATIAGKLALPENVDLSTVQELKVLAKLSAETSLVNEATKEINAGVRQFDIAKVNKYNQFSLKLTGIAADSDLTVQIYVKTADGTYVSQAVTLTAN